jgi:hypothetical protein
VVEHRDVIFDEVPTHDTSRSFPLLIDDSQHVTMDLSPPHYDVGPTVNPTSVFSSTLTMVTR